MNVDLERPRDCKQDEDPKIVRPQSTSESFPNADRKVRSQKIGGDMLGPFLIRWDRSMRKHGCKISGLEDADTIRPDFVIPIPPGLHEQEDRNEDRVDRDREMRIIG